MREPQRGFGALYPYGLAVTEQLNQMINRATASTGGSIWSLRKNRDERHLRLERVLLGVVQESRSQTSRLTTLPDTHLPRISRVES